MTSAPPRQGLPLRFGYGTNGFSNHSLDNTLTVLTDLGCNGVALTLHHAHLNPFDAGLARRVSALRARLDDAGLAVVVETGARYLLDGGRQARSHQGRNPLPVPAELSRRTVVARLVLGSTFNAPDLLWYAVGAVLGWLVHASVTRRPGQVSPVASARV